jgi:nicotinamidase-related amidase
VKDGPSCRDWSGNVNETGHDSAAKRPVEVQFRREADCTSSKYHKHRVQQPMLLSAEQSALLVVDIQMRLAPAVADAEAIVGRAGVLLAAAAILHVPVIVSEQYPQGLGHTDERLLPLLEGARVFAKTAFAAARDPAILAHLEALARPQLVLAGMEAHVCVLQTALALRELGFAVAVAADAVGSRRPERRELGLERMRANGVEVVDSEMVVFEWLGEAGTPVFRELSRLIR